MCEEESNHEVINDQSSPETVHWLRDRAFQIVCIYRSDGERITSSIR